MKKKIIRNKKPIIEHETTNVIEVPSPFRLRLLKTVSYRGDERDTTKWMNEFCSDKGDSVKNVSVTCDGRAYTAFISYWSEE